MIHFLIFFLIFLSTNGENIKNIENSADVQSDIALLLENRVVDDVNNENLGMDRLRRKLFRSGYERESDVYYSIGNIDSRYHRYCWQFSHQSQAEQECNRHSDCLGYAIYNGNTPLCLMFGLDPSKRTNTGVIDTFWKGCQDTSNGYCDSYGDCCDEYHANKHWCGDYDTSNFRSNEMCCACGGGK